MSDNHILVQLVPSDLHRYLTKLDTAGSAYHFTTDKKLNGVHELELMVDGGYPGITVTLSLDGTWSLVGTLPLPSP